MRIYTRQGDDGSTGLFLGGRLSKADALMEACGDVDEAVAVLGTARAAATEARLADLVLQRQRELFVVAADLATNPRHRDRLVPEVSSVTEAMVERLERLTDELVEERPLRPVFVVPGATAVSAALDHARAVVRRAERHVVAAREAGHEVSPLVVQHLNRLSDLLFAAARWSVGDLPETASHD